MKSKMLRVMVVGVLSLLASSVDVPVSHR